MSEIAQHEIFDLDAVSSDSDEEEEPLRRPVPRPTPTPFRRTVQTTSPRHISDDRDIVPREGIQLYASSSSEEPDTPLKVTSPNHALLSPVNIRTRSRLGLTKSMAQNTHRRPTIPGDQSGEFFDLNDVSSSSEESVPSPADILPGEEQNFGRKPGAADSTRDKNHQSYTPFRPSKPVNERSILALIDMEFGVQADPAVSSLASPARAKLSRTMSGLSMASDDGDASPEIIEISE